MPERDAQTLEDRNVPRYSITKIEGIGASHARKLGAAGIRSTHKLLDECHDRKGRKAVAKETGFTEKTLLKWTNMADLMRVRGIGEEYSELLEAAGVDTVKELKTRRADNLTTAIEKANNRRKLVRRTPSETVVTGWIKEAKKLKAVVKY